MKKIALLLLCFIFISLNVSAKSIKKDFSTVIKDSGVDVESIAVSIKNANNGKAIYTLNDKILMNPASVQKILTTPVSYEVLGENYAYNTSLYQRDEETYILKLGADPYLKTEDIKTLIKNISPEIKKLYIDDSILDNKTWGEGWQWDDDMNILMPRFSSYNLDRNLIKLTIIPDKNGQFATIINPSKYPLVFFNHIKTGDKTDLKIHRDNTISTNTLMMEGTIARATTVYIPTNSLQKYFILQLTKALEERNIYLKQPITTGKIKTDDILKQEISHDINKSIDDILKTSNNLMSETLFKIAGARYCNIETGTDSAGIKMFNDYCIKNKIDNSRIKLTDASGVSKNNLVSADFVTEFLIVNKNNKIMDKLPTPSEGTLTHRMLVLKNNLKAKTGTLSDNSTIAGYLTTKNGKKIVFCIMINDMQLSSSDKKMLEDFIIREAYLQL